MGNVFRENEKGQFEEVRTRTEFRAVFSYPSMTNSYGRPCSTEDEARQDRPIRPEETWGQLTGIQKRIVTEWEDMT